MSGKETLLLTLGSTFPFTVGDFDSASTPGERVLFERLRLSGWGGGSSLGMICLNLQTKVKHGLVVNKFVVVYCI